MAHIHSVYDTDNHFKIDVNTRKIESEKSNKTSVVQFDHNSERFTFELPRYIEGHDMAECNKVEVHYLNLCSETKKRATGVYTVDDLKVSEEDENTVICSWLISSGATVYAGSLSFLLRFSCLTDNEIEYAWNTGVHTEIYVANGLDASDSFLRDYVDVIEQWKDYVMAVFTGDIREWENEKERELTEWKNATAVAVREEAFADIAAESKRVDLLSNYVTPQMFGAKGDGIADDTDAIQQCLSNYSAVVIPDGTYLISHTLTMNKANQAVKGLSASVIIKASDNMSGDMLVMDGSLSPAYRSNQQLSSLHLKGNGSCNGIRLRKNADVFVSNAKVSDCDWGIVSTDSLLYNFFATTVIDCTNGIHFVNSNELSAANNVCFEMCKIIQIARYAIYTDDGNSTHNVVFQCCEIEATNTDSADISPVTLQSMSSSGASPIMVFRNCWFEQNNGTVPVLITGTDGNQKQYIFDGCSIINAANACECFISASGRTLAMINQSDPCTYAVASIKMRAGRLFILGGIFSYDVDDENTVTHLGYDGFVNSNLVFRNSHGTRYKSAGGTDYNSIFAQSNKLKIKADTEVIELDGAKGVDMANSFVKPMILGSVYLWTYKNTVYCKYGSRPTAYNDGTVLINLQ